MTTRAANWVPVFPEEEIPFILAAVIRSGSHLRKSHRQELENNLTDRLRDKLDRDSVFRSRPIELFREVPLYDRRRARRKQLGRTDLMFLYSTGARKPWPYFVIESKRLHVTFKGGWQSLIPEYVTGDQGMMCFVERRYARDLSNGGMLGYVFDGKIKQARSAVAKCIEQNNQQLRCTLPSLRDCSFRAGRGKISMSIHSFSDGSFTIFHLFLRV